MIEPQQGWQMSALGNPLFAAGEFVSPVFQQAPGIFVALAVDTQLKMNEVFLDLSKPQGWQVRQFGNRAFLPGTPISPVFQQTPGHLAAVAVDTDVARSASACRMRDIRGRSPMTEAARLPDFIFARDPEIEQRDGHALAGKLITNICRSCGEPTSAQRRLVKQIIESLIETAAENPDFDEAEIWLGETKPADGAMAPFNTELLRARRAACRVVAVRVDRSPSLSVH